MSGSQRRQEQEHEKDGGTSLTEGASVSGLVRATQLPHDDEIEAAWSSIWRAANALSNLPMRMDAELRAVLTGSDWDRLKVHQHELEHASRIVFRVKSYLDRMTVTGSGTDSTSAERAEVPTCARIGERIRMHRTGQGLSLRDVADRAGLSHAYLSELENDAADAKKPSVDVVERVAHALGVSPSYLAGWTVGSGNQPTSAERAVERAGALAPSNSPNLTSQTPSGSVEQAKEELREVIDERFSPDREAPYAIREDWALVDAKIDALILAVQHSKEQDAREVSGSASDLRNARSVQHSKEQP